MILEPCHCSWDIPGIDELPAHHHPASPGDRYVPGSFITKGPLAGQRMPRGVPDPECEPAFWVDWRAVNRALGPSQEP